MIKWLNNYFFDEDSTCLSDALYFYGTILIMLVVGVVIWFI